ncbi:MAG: transposase [Phycisphaerae bacterium]|nr:transposase [Phycisphaerae bacterium]
MAKPLVTDKLWTLIEPYIPVKRRRWRHPGRRRLPNRACLSGIVLVSMSGIPWEMLPQEMVCGSGMTCWRRLDITRPFSRSAAS